MPKQNKMTKDFAQLREATSLASLGGVRVDLNKLESVVVNKELTHKKLVSYIAKIGNKYITKREDYGFEVVFSTSTVPDQGQMMINAYFDPEEDAEGEVSIEIDLVFHNKDKTIVLSKEGFAWLVNNILSAITHEMIHQSQYRSRGHIRGKQFKKYTSTSTNVQKAQKYLGNTDEVEAYGFNIANGLLINNSYEDAIAFLKNPKKDTMSRSPDLFGYMVAFGFDTNHPIIKRLLTKTDKHK